MSCHSLQDNACGLKVSPQKNIDSMVHPIGTAGNLRSLQRLGAMDEAQVVLPSGIETTKINAREGVTLLTGVQKREEDSLLLVQ